MFKFRRKKSLIDTLIRANEIQVGDRFVYDCDPVEVLDVYPDTRTTTVRIGSTQPGSYVRTRVVGLQSNLLMLVPR